MISKPSVLCVAMGLLLVLLAPGIGAAAGAVAVAEAVIATGVEDLVPTGVGTSFPATIGRLYCFTKVVGAEPPTHIKHLWYYEGRRMAEVTLRIKQARFRTYSSKRITPAWRGRWSVEIVGEDGTLLRFVEFIVQ